MTNPDNDQMLVALAKNGDTAAFATLVERHQNKVYRFILKYVHAPTDARDLTQEALLQAFRCLAGFNETARFSTWLTGIALNLARNFVNRSPRGEFVEYQEELLPASLEDVSGDPARSHERNTFLGALSSSIDALPEEMREYIVLLGLEGCSYEEIAELLGVPLGTVKSKVSRARQKLREIMKQRGYFS
jgi:RNA polymerase sigma-70 factor, ECF subfamily